MALNKLKFNSLNVTPTAGKTIGFNSSANGLEATLSGGAVRFIKKLTASSDSTLSFVDGSSDVVLDNTYKEYMFIFNNIHPATDNVEPRVQFNKSGASGFNETLTTSTFHALLSEDGGTQQFTYRADYDQAQGTSFQNIANAIGNGNDESFSGYLRLFNPSSTTFVTHFQLRTNSYYYGDISVDSFYAGYINATEAIDEVQFKFSSGNIDSGTITLYGIN